LSLLFTVAPRYIVFAAAAAVVEPNVVAWEEDEDLSVTTSGELPLVASFMTDLLADVGSSSLILAADCDCWHYLGSARMNSPVKSIRNCLSCADIV
jgi:hypothetical protein